jgi:hypothetical protein
LSRRRWATSDGDTARDDGSDRDTGPRACDEVASSDDRPQLLGPILKRSLRRTRFDVVRHVSPCVTGFIL